MCDPQILVLILVLSRVPVLFLVQFAAAELDYVSNGEGMSLQGDYTIAGLFPLFNSDEDSGGQPALGPCNKGRTNSHGFHLMQALRFTVEQINNSSGPGSLLPGLRLGYQLYDICSVPASILATLDLLESQHRVLYPTEGQGGQQGQGLEAVAVIGPDSSSKSFTPAALLGSYLIPQISYEASNEMLSNKNLYPSFFRTIPSDKNQVAAMIQLLVRFNWTWIALLGSDNDYGLQGMQSLAAQAPYFDICIAYQGIIPSASAGTASQMRQMVEGILTTKVNTIVVFSSKSKLSGFMPYVIEKNVTNKVWIATEDWSAATLISGIPGVHTIGTVLGVSVKSADVQGFAEFERRDYEASVQHNDSGGESGLAGDDCLQSTDLYSLAKNGFGLETYDLTSSFNVYKAVYAVAHALHALLGCDSKRCSNRTVLPWELLPWLKKVRFSIDNTSVYFDKNGDPPTGYDIVTWIWRGPVWSLRLVGSFSPDPVTLLINEDLIEWSQTESAEPNQVPLSICSPPCPFGHKKILTGQHVCCFDCQPCPAATFFNKSDPTNCQSCPPEEWAPAKSEQCLNRTILLLSWDDPLTIALLFFMACCLFMTVSSAIILLVHITTPVAKSAGGRTCLLMLASLTLAALSSLCHFGPPSPLACLLKHPLFIFSFTVCLAAITVRSFQVVCIFKFASKLPPIYDKWAKKHGPEWTIFTVSFAILVISALRVAIDPPKPSQDLAFYDSKIVLECSNTLSIGSMVELVYVSILSMLCFFFSYMGKDLPANYNEAKCVTFSLMVYMISWISFFTLYLISRDPFTMAAHVFAVLFSVLAFYGGYFLPKMYIIIMKPELNTTAHFQNCIQMYTMSKQ